MFYSFRSYTLMALALLLLQCRPQHKNAAISYWTEIAALSLQSEELPSQYKSLSLDLDALNNALDSNQKIAIPMPDGTFIQAQLTNSGTMSPELAKKFPEIKSLKFDEGTISGRIDINPSGFYAMIITDGQTHFVNPIKKNSTEYICYKKADAKRNMNNPFFEPIGKP